MEQLSKQLEDARVRRDKLRSAGLGVDHVDREIVELRRQLREGGRLRPGDALGDGRYLLVKVVGRGGFAVVWEAYDCVEQQRIAIKVLHSNLAGDPQRRERFFRGARAMMQLAHPAVVRVLEPHGEDGGFYYFVMDFVAGGDLREAVLAQRVKSAELLPLILQVGDALALAHRQNMVHRDVKPSNILLGDRSDAKLTDFDLVGAQDTTGGTRTGALGTVVYAAPECLERPQDATARADVYGLGMTAIFCLAARDLSMDTFRNPDATIDKLACSTRVQAVLRRAVAWQPHERFADAAALMLALRHALNLRDGVTVIDTWQTAPRPDDVQRGSQELTQSAHLRMLAGECARPVYPVEMQGLSIGREDCDVVIVDDPQISRKHARIERSFADWQFQDLGSRNGFYLNGREFGRGQRVALADGSVIRLGDSVMVFRTTPLPADPRIDSPVFPGVSPEAASVRRRIDELADSSGHVLILGETGTGKESVAKAIGALRAPHPFVTLNCAQLSRELARSELFGHVHGAFTPALSTRPGLIDLAGEGALFLDEIAGLPLDVQAELLRFLEDGSYRALGSTDLRKSPARVLAATNINLDEAGHHGRFRRDLLARLRAINTPLTLPPLRERREDILGSTQLFFRLRGREPGARPWTADALEWLLLYPWQGNLRELLAAVNFAAAQTSEFPCTRAHLLAQVREHGTGPDPTRDEIIEILRQNRGKMRSTAQMLKIDRRRLYRLSRTYDINPNDYRDGQAPENR